MVTYTHDDALAVRQQPAKFRVHLEDLKHPATARFLELSNCAHIIQDAVEEVHRHLYKAFGKPQAVRSVTLVLESMGGVAYTTGIPLDDMHKEIHLSLEYIERNLRDLARFKHECTGVVTHEMVHCYQHNCCGTAPGGLIEGIADFVRLKAGLAPPHWKKDKEHCGKKWDEGYEKTAFFLEWLEDRFGEGCIGRMNAHMDGQRYVEDKFWHDLFGESVDFLWKKYVKHYDHDNDDEGGDESSSVASTEAELVDLSAEERQEANGDFKHALEFQA